MNLEKLKAAEEKFLETYPGGFDNPEMVRVKKKHNMDRMIRFARESFAPENFGNPHVVTDRFIKLVSRSSMVSVFEKPKLRDYLVSLDPGGTHLLAAGLEKRLHGDEQAGFEMMMEVLAKGRLAKWPLISICGVCYRPDHDVFVKPTTAKNVIAAFELKTLAYKPTPTWAFYREYREVINEMKTRVDPSLSPSNAAFTGFLMMAL